MKYLFKTNFNVLNKHDPNPLTSETIKHCLFNLLTPQQTYKWFADFGKNMYSDFTKYRPGSKRLPTF